MDDADLLLRLGIAAAALDPAPVRARGADAESRVGRNSVPCVLCGEPARFTRVVHLTDRGPRWLDRCRVCFLATVAPHPRPAPTATAALLEDLRQAAAQARVALTIRLADEAG
jgi:hypothetical protein